MVRKGYTRDRECCIEGVYMLYRLVCGDDHPSPPIKLFRFVNNSG